MRRIFFLLPLLFFAGCGLLPPKDKPIGLIASGVIEQEVADGGVSFSGSQTTAGKDWIVSREKTEKKLPGTPNIVYAGEEKWNGTKVEVFNYVLLPRGQEERISFPALIIYKTRDMNNVIRTLSLTGCSVTNDAGSFDYVLEPTDAMDVLLQSTSFTGQSQKYPCGLKKVFSLKNKESFVRRNDFSDFAGDPGITIISVEKK